MRPTTRTRVFAFLFAGLVAVACGSALAFFTTNGVGTAATGVSSLSKPTIASATPAAGGTVTVTWGAVTPPQSGTVTYYVSRDGQSAAGSCPTAAVPTTVTTCVDKNVEPGTHQYEVTALWRSWTATSSVKSATVTVGAATHLTLSAATTTPTAAATDNLTISARDVNEAVVTTYTGAKNLVFSGASASPSGTAANVINSSGTTISFGATTAITFSNGVASVASSKNGVMKLYRAGSANIAVTDGTISTEVPLAVTVSPAALAKFVLGVESTTPAVGTADNLTITAQDAYGNVTTSHDGVKSMIFTGGTTSLGGNVATVTDSTGEPTPFGNATPIRFESGVATVSAVANGEMRLYRTGAQLIKVAEGAIVSATVSVSPMVGTPVRFAVTGSPTTTTANTIINLTITAQDEFANTVTTYTGSKNLTFSGASASPNGTLPTVAPSSTTTGVAFGSATAITFASGVATASSSKNGAMKIYRVGSAAITVSDGTISNPAPLNVTISAGTLSKFVLAAETTTPVVGAADDLTITAQDAYGNTVITHSGLKSLTFSGVAASPGGTVSTVSDSEGNAIALGTATPVLFAEGVATASGPANGEARLYRSGLSTFKVAEGSIFGTLGVTPSPLVAAKLSLGSSLSSFAAGSTANLTTTAQDAYGNTATSYAGAKSLVFSGASASPGGTAPTVVNTAGAAIAFGAETELTFAAGIATVTSSKNGVLRLYRSGVTPIAASDGSISTAAPVNVTVTATTAAKLILTHVAVSAGTIGSPCLFSCSITGLGNSGTIVGGVAVTDTYGNINSGIGTGHNAAVTVVSGGGAVTAGTFTFPNTGPAESPSDFTYTAPVSGAYTASLKAAATAGTAYANATITATK